MTTTTNNNTITEESKFVAWLDANGYKHKLICRIPYLRRYLVSKDGQIEGIQFGTDASAEYPESVVSWYFANPNWRDEPEKDEERYFVLHPSHRNLCNHWSTNTKEI